MWKRIYKYLFLRLCQLDYLIIFDFLLLYGTEFCHHLSPNTTKNWKQSRFRFLLPCPWRRWLVGIICSGCLLFWVLAKNTVALPLCVCVIVSINILYCSSRSNYVCVNLLLLLVLLISLLLVLLQPTSLHQYNMAL